MSGGTEPEVPLRGGRTTPGIVKVGDTVRRPSGPNAGRVRVLLRRLHAAGFHAVPRALGIDDRGRDVLSFIPGDVPAELSVHTDHVLSAAAQLIRRLHDATATLLDAPAARHAEFEVVCHNDLSPCNFVFVDGLPAAVIDFDAASPGTRAHDLAYAAWLWLDLGSPDVSPAEQRRRLSLFLNAYGPHGATRTDITQAILIRQAMAVARGQETGNAAMSAWAEACRDWTVRHEAVLTTGP